MTENRPEPIFIAGALGLDFLNSIATPVDTPVEWLSSGEDLLQWLERAGLVPADIAAEMRTYALPGELDGVAEQARALREWFRGFVHEHRGKQLKQTALSQLEPLNRVLARDEQFGQIVARGRDPRAGSGLSWLQQRRWRSPDMLLVAIAQAMADVICNEDFAQIKACEGRPCTLLFLDRTRARGRRWCSMDVCGNRAKQAAHRERTQRGRDRATTLRHH